MAKNDVAQANWKISGAALELDPGNFGHTERYKILCGCGENTYLTRSLLDPWHSIAFIEEGLNGTFAMTCQGCGRKSVLPAGEFRDIRVRKTRWTDDNKIVKAVGIALKQEVLAEGFVWPDLWDGKSHDALEMWSAEGVPDET